MGQARTIPGNWWRPLAIGLVAFLAYFPALGGGFVWDDDQHVTTAALASFRGLGRIWFELGATPQYYPLLHTAFWVEHHLWGDAAAGYHLVNVALHATAACLLALVVRALGRPAGRWVGNPADRPPEQQTYRFTNNAGWLAAALFAVHPVGAESVAWVSEQKNTLSAVWYLLAALAYLRFAAGRNRRRYALASALFACALLTKSVTATLPAALLVLFWWRDGPAGLRREWRPLLPWIVVGVASGLFTAHVEREFVGAQGADFDLSLLQRGLLAGRILWFYLGKLAWPRELMFIYPRWTIDASAAWAYLLPLGFAGLLFLLWMRKWRGALAALLIFAGTLFPALGFFDVYPFRFSFVADHFQYLASMAVFALAAAGAVAAFARSPRWVGPAVVAGVLGVLATRTWRQCGRYRNAEVFYQAILAENPACWLAQLNLGTLEAAAGRVEAAIARYQEALRLKPDYAEAEVGLGVILAARGQPAEARVHYENALRDEPNSVVALYNLGTLLLNMGRPAEALPFFERVLARTRFHADAEEATGLALARLDRIDDAIGHFQAALRIDPDHFDALVLLGSTLRNRGRNEESVAALLRAERVRSLPAEIQDELGLSLLAAGRPAEAVARFEAAVRENPRSPDFASDLAEARRAVEQQRNATAPR